MSGLIAIFVRGQTHGRNDCRDLIKFLICMGEINSGSQKYKFAELIIKGAELIKELLKFSLEYNFYILWRNNPSRVWN